MFFFFLLRRKKSVTKAIHSKYDFLIETDLGEKNPPPTQYENQKQRKEVQNQKQIRINGYKYISYKHFFNGRSILQPSPGVHWRKKEIIIIPKFQHFLRLMKGLSAYHIEILVLVESLKYLCKLLGIPYAVFLDVKVV